MTTKRIKGTQEDFEKALDEINPDSNTHYNIKSSEEDTEEKKGLLSETGGTKKEKLDREAIQTLITACEIAQKEGAFMLDEARTIINAIDFLNNSD
jgi:hypothetical protein